MSIELLISVFFLGRFRIVAAFPSRYSKHIALVSVDPGLILWRVTFFPPLFFPFFFPSLFQLDLAWVQSPADPTFPAYHTFFLPFFSPLSYTSFFPSFFILFCPPLISSSPFPLPSFFFFFLLLFSHSFSSSSFFFFLYFFLSPILFPLLFFLYFFSSPFCFLFSLSFSFILFSWFFPPFPLLSLSSFSPFNHFFLFIFISPLCECEGGCHKTKKIKVEKSKNNESLVVSTYYKHFSHLLALPPALSPTIHSRNPGENTE